MEKKDNLLRYYEAEMRYLTEAADDFAQAHPESANHLRMNDSLQRDPMVERLFEAFAFLNAKLYQKIDDDMPELTEQVLGLLWPHYLRSMASMSVVRLKPNREVGRHQCIEAGLGLQTAFDDQTGLHCEFRTTARVDVYPLVLAGARLTHNPLGQSIIQLQLALSPEISEKNIVLPEKFDLKVYLTGEMETKLSLYDYLINHLDYITTDEHLRQRSRRIHIDRCHFTTDDVSWLKHQPYAATERDILMEYFLFREKFLFFEIKGLSQADFDQPQQQLLINCHLNRDFPLQLSFDESYFQLFCTPVINAFELEAEPVRRTVAQLEYQLRPMHAKAEYMTVLDVVKVESYSQRTAKRQQYLPFHEFKQGKKSLDITAASQPYYHVHVRQGTAQQYETYMAFAEDTVQMEDEVVSVTIRASQGDLPRQISKYNKHMTLSSSVLGIESAEMMMVPTPMYYPPDFKNQHWQWLFEMGHNYLATLDTHVLKNSLHLLDWSGVNRNKQYIEAIESVSRHIVHRAHRGMMIRCIRIDISLDSSAFINEADAALFAYALNQYLISLAPLNLVVEVHFQLEPNGYEFHWPVPVQEVIG
ncbi:type VI secretion system baseplate subunit TssF [Neisseriaceae bacterium ESL0693]|nr:type VI secretion system baseplate subunit TssF [Neisseriaceae bacterium ESL0693]